MRRHDSTLIVLLIIVIFLLVALLFRGTTPPAPVALTLTSETPITVFFKAPDGSNVLPPRTMPLWQYVDVPRASTEASLTSFMAEFEADLHRHDPTFHLTHEFIDGKVW